MTMDYKLIGVPCGHYGPYTFYKAFKYNKNGKTNILALSEFFFVKLWNDSDLISIGELQLLWEDKTIEQTLASLRLYILPENTPEGRNSGHGEDEVLAITEKLVIKLDDLLTWIADATDWNWGLSAVWNRDKSGKKYNPPVRPQLLNDCTVIDLEDIDKEKDQLDESHWETNIGVVVLSFPRYCRYRGILKRLEGVHNEWLKTALVVALGAFTVPCRNTRVLFCKDTFDYPELEGHELLCNHLAPKLKVGPKRKRRRLNSRTPSPEESEESESESSVKSSISSSSNTTITNNINNNNNNNTNNNNNKSKTNLPLNKNKNGLNPTLSPRRSARASITLQEKEFLAKLYGYMKSKQMPINRVPTIGFKEIDLFAFYNKVTHLGGYDSVTAGRLWKYVYEEIGGDQNSTSAATICRRHYEKLLLPYERQFCQNNSSIKGKQINEVASSTTPATTTATTTIKTSDIISKEIIIPSVTIKPIVNSPIINVPKPSILDKDKKSVGGLTSKPGSLRGVRLKQDKSSSNHSLIEGKNGGKENIPVKNSSKSSSSTPIKQQTTVLSESVELISDDSQSPSKANENAATAPSLKKPKLEILKEGGLEVTAVATTVATSDQDNKINNDSKTVESEKCDSSKISPTNANNNNSINNNLSVANSIAKSSSSSNSNSNKSVSNDSVNCITSSNSSVANQSNSSSIKNDDKRPSVIKHAHPNDRNKISITITPDVSTMLTMSGLPSSRTPQIVSSKSSQQHRPTHLLPGIWQGRTVYGNPKEVVQHTSRSVTDEVLDLRKKNDDKNSSLHQPIKNNPINATKSSYRPIGSNLEITLVPATKNTSINTTIKSVPPSTHTLIPQSHQQKRRKNNAASSQPLFSNGCNLNNASLRNLSIGGQQYLNMSKQQTSSVSPLIIPNVSLTVNHNHKKPIHQSTSQNNHHNQKKVMSQQISSTSTSPSQHSQHSSRTSHTNSVNSAHSSNNRLTPAQLNMLHQLNFQNHQKMPFIPGGLDPIYLSALFGLAIPQNSIPASTHSSLQSNNLFNAYPTPEQSQSYLELLRRHSLPHTTLPDGFPRLLNDGSTSITLVKTPTSK